MSDPIKPSPSASSATIPLVTQEPVRVGDVLKLLYESTAGQSMGQDSWDILDGLDPESCSVLLEEILEHQEALDENERDAFRQGDHAQMKSILRRIVDKRDAKALAPNADGQEAAGGTPSAQVIDSWSEQASSPPEQAHALAPDHVNSGLDAGTADKNSEGPSMQGPTLQNTKPQNIASDLLALAYHPMEKPGKLVMRYPEKGYSGQLDSLPLEHIFPPALKSTWPSLKMNHIADFLARTRTWQGRCVLSRSLGMSLGHTVELSKRSELLDLPVSRREGDFLHWKDVLLLGRFGIRSRNTLEGLAAYFLREPESMALWVRLAQLHQKIEPKQIGRQPWTRKLMLAWLRAAETAPDGLGKDRDPKERWESSPADPQLQVSQNDCLTDQAIHWAWAEIEGQLAQSPLDALVAGAKSLLELSSGKPKWREKSQSCAQDLIKHLELKSHSHSLDINGSEESAAGSARTEVEARASEAGQSDFGALLSLQAEALPPRKPGWTCYSVSLAGYAATRQICFDELGNRIDSLE